MRASSPSYLKLPAVITRLPSIGIEGATAPVLISTLLGIAIVMDAVSIGHSLLPVREAISIPNRLILQGPGARRGLNDISTIVNAHLFGFAPASPGSDANAPLSQNPLSLTATFSMSNPDHGFAIIAANGQAGVLYAVGANVGAATVLQRVYADHVILNRSGALEKLELRTHPGNALGAPAAPTRVAAIAPVGSAGVSRATASPFVRLQTITLMPVFGDASRGARIGMPRNPMEFRKNGLRAGDIITAINGTPVHSVQGAADQLKATNGGALNVTVQRDGQSQTVQVESLE